VPFRAEFGCLWCGRHHATRGPDDLEGWAQLCPDCLGRAGDNDFLRFRLHRAIADRAHSRPAADASRGAARIAVGASSMPSADDEDDWLLRRGRQALGPVHDTAWAAELDAAGRWLDALPIQGRIVELAAGTGWWSPLLAGKGELTAYDARPDALERLRSRLVAHGLLAHVHERGPDDEPEGPPADAVLAAFLVGRSAAGGRSRLLGRARRWLRPGGLLATIDALGPAGRPGSDAAGEPDTLDGPSLERAMRDAGLVEAGVTVTGRFLLLGRAIAA
jgi:SAM-dependent methyltransferase